MKRLVYWMKRCLKMKNIHCHSFCATCEYYDQCRSDGEDINGR